jgi:hypothetical protein
MQSRSIALTFAFTLALNSGAQSLGANLPANLDALVSGYWQPTVTAAFGTFTWDYTDLPSPFSRWFEDELGSAVLKTGRLKLFNRSAAAAMDPSFKAIYGDFFTKTGIDALLAGRFNIEGAGVKVHLELTGLSDGILIGTTDVRVSLAALPSGLDIEPRRQVREQAASLIDILPKVAVPQPGISNAGIAVKIEADSALVVSASTDRGRGAVYREGENLVVLAAVNQPAYVRVYHIDANGIVQRIWPNRFGGGEGRLTAGAAIRIPAANDPFSFLMGPPYGTEFIKVVASTRSFAIDDRDFTDLGGDLRGIVTRGLPTGGESDGLIAEAMASYVIVPGP